MGRSLRLLRDVAPTAVVGFVAIMGTRGVDAYTGNRDVGVLGWTLVVVACVALLARTALPVATLLVAGAACAGYLMLGLPYGPVMFTVGLASWTAARRAPPRLSLGAAAAVVVAVLVHLLYLEPAIPVQEQIFRGWLEVLPVAGWVVVPYVVGSLVRMRDEVAVRTREHTMSEQVAQERLRLSQEVHDVVGHGLSAIKMQADVALHVAAGGGTASATPALEAISASAGAALRELRDVLGQMQPGDDRVVSRGMRDLDALRERMESAGVDLDVRTEGVPRRLPAGHDLTAYRVLQESLTNVLRHGGVRQGLPARADVVVGWRADAIELEVVNPVTSPRVSADGTGLTGMRARVEDLGGTFTAGHVGTGFVVRARIPTSGGDA